MDLPQESHDALAASLKRAVLEATGLEIGIEFEKLPMRVGTLTMFVVTIPADATPEQRDEANYIIDDLGPLFRYVDQPGPLSGDGF